MSTATRSTLRRVFRFLGIGSLVASVALVALTIAAVAFVRQAAGRIVFNVDPAAFGKMINEAMTLTLKDGTREQKLELIASFAMVSPTDAAPYAPFFAEATKDQDPDVRQAATAALERIPPEAFQPATPE